MTWRCREFYVPETRALLHGLSRTAPQSAVRLGCACLAPALSGARRAPTPTIRTVECWPSDTRATRTSLVGALSGSPRDTRPTCPESPAQPSRANPPRRIPVAPAHKRSPHRSPRFRSRWGSSSSLSARFSKNSIAQLSSVFLRVDRDPEFLASRRMTEEPMTTLTASHLGLFRDRG